MPVETEYCLVNLVEKSSTSGFFSSMSTCFHRKIFRLWLFDSGSPCAGLHKDNVMIAFSRHRFAFLDQEWVVCDENIFFVPFFSKLLRLVFQRCAPLGNKSTKDLNQLLN